MSKRILSFLLAAILIFSVFSAAAPAYAAADDTMKKLISLTKKFPHKMYWNHVGSKENKPDSVTTLPCPSHEGISWDSEEKTCNSFDNAIQCMGFAYKIAYEITGESPRNWEMSEKLNAKKLRVGDVIRYRYGSHSLTVTGIKGKKISFVDANWYPGCQIRWDTMELDEMPGFTYVLHKKGNGRKNTNLDFHKKTVELGNKRETALLDETESWQMNDEGSLNVRAGASVKKSVLGLIPANATFSVSEKKNAKDHLWGLVTYGSLEGWAVLDYSKYLSGENNAPVVTKPKGVFATGENITVKWKKTSGASAYKITVKSSKGKKLLSFKTRSSSAEFSLKTPDKVKVTVTSLNSHTPSWKLKSSPVTFTVLNKEDIKVTSVKFSESSVSVVKGEKAQLEFTVAPYNAGNQKLAFKSSDKNVAAVNSNGRITAKSFGKVKITASSLDSPDVSAACTVSVVPGETNELFQTSKKTKKDRITVQWKKVPGASGYRLYKYNKAKNKYKLICETEKTAFTVTDLKAGTGSYYCVRAFALVKEKKLFGDFSSPVLLSTVPESPTVNVKTTESKAVFKWKKVKGATGYEIYLKKNGKYVLQGTSSKPVFEKELSSKEKCVLRVRAVTKGKTATLYSGYSKAVTARR